MTALQEETKDLWVLDVTGRKVHGPATGISCDTDPGYDGGWSGPLVRHVRSYPVRKIVHFLQGDVEARYIAESEAGLDAIIERERQEEHHRCVETERRRMRDAHKVRITDLVGQVIQKVQIGGQTIVFTLQSGDVWAFDALYGEWDPVVERPWILANGGAVTRVESEYTLKIYTDRQGYVTIPAVIDQEYDPEYEEFAVGTAYEPDADEIESLPVIAGEQ